MFAFSHKEKEDGADIFAEALKEWKDGIPEHTVTIEIYSDDYSGGWLIAVLPHSTDANDVHIDFLGETSSTKYSLTLYMGAKGYRVLDGQCDIRSVLAVLDAARNGLVEERIWPYHSELDVTVPEGIITSKISALPCIGKAYRFLGTEPRSVLRYPTWTSHELKEDTSLNKDGKSGMRIVARF